MRWQHKASHRRVGSIAAVVYKSTIYSPRSEFVIILRIVTQIRIYRVDIEDSGSPGGARLHCRWIFIASIKSLWHLHYNITAHLYSV